MLKKAIDETGAKVVLSSSWRYTRNAQFLKELLLQYGIYTNSTPFLQNKRGLEIKKWLDNNPSVEDFVILDDEVYDSYTLTDENGEEIIEAEEDDFSDDFGLDVADGDVMHFRSSRLDPMWKKSHLRTMFTWN